MTARRAATGEAEQRRSLPSCLAAARLAPTVRRGERSPVVAGLHLPGAGSRVPIQTARRRCRKGADANSDNLLTTPVRGRASTDVTAGLVGDPQPRSWCSTPWRPSTRATRARDIPALAATCSSVSPATYQPVNSSSPGPRPATSASPQPTVLLIPAASRLPGYSPSIQSALWSWIIFPVHGRPSTSVVPAGSRHIGQKGGPLPGSRNGAPGRVV